MIDAKLMSVDNVKQLVDNDVYNKVQSAANKLRKFIEYQAAVKKTYDTFHKRQNVPQGYFFNTDSIQFVKVNIEKQDVCKYSMNVVITDYGVQNLQPQALDDVKSVIYGAKERL